MTADFILIEMFQASVTGIVKLYHYQHNGLNFRLYYKIGYLYGKN